MKLFHGLPVITADGIDEAAESLGIRPWPIIQGPLSLADYASQQLSDKQRKELDRFCPPIQATVFQHPRGDHHTYFRVTPPSFGGVLALIKDSEDGQYYVVLILEFTQGLNDLLLTPPCGGLEQQDRERPEPFAACAEREFQNETGFKLRCVVPLAGSRVGIGVSGRQDNQRIHSFWGVLMDPIERVPQKLDPTEHHAVVLMSLDEWFKHLRNGRYVNETSYTMAMLAALNYPEIMLPVMQP